MRVEKVGDNTICFFAETQKELALTFFRVQEYYESRNPVLWHKTFDAFDFLDAMMNKKGEIDYFSDWDGFNVPGNIFKSWMASTAFDKRSKYEEKMIDEIFKYIAPGDDFYVIGMREKDKTTLRHELSHASFYLNKQFKDEATNIAVTFSLTQPKTYKKVLNGLKKLEYSDNVLVDELIAWLGTSSKNEIIDTFDVEFAEIETFVKLFRKLLRKYNI